MWGSGTINVIIGTEEPKLEPFRLCCDRRGIDIYGNRNSFKAILLVRYEGAILEGSNTQDYKDNIYLKLWIESKVIIIITLSIIALLAHLLKWQKMEWI